MVTAGKYYYILGSSTKLASWTAPGVNLLEASAKKPLELALKALLTVNDECGLIANGVDNTNYDVPKDLTGMIAAAKKHQAVFAMNVKAHVSDARSNRR